MDGKSSFIYYLDLKKTLSVYLEPEQLKRLKAWNQETGAPVAELIRRAIDLALSERDREKRRVPIKKTSAREV